MPASRDDRRAPPAAVSRGSPRPQPTRVVWRRRAAVAALAIAATATGIAVGSASSGNGTDPAAATTEAPKPAGRVRLELGGRTLADEPVTRLERRRAQAALVSSVPATVTIVEGPARIQAATQRAALTRSLARTVAAGGGDLKVPWTPLASTIGIPVIKQTLQDDCEATALSMLLRFAGKRVDQLTLQRQVAHSPPLDPEIGPEGEVWGDPETGFVGRADGGGPGGGFGVYQGPIVALARKHGLDPNDLTGKSPKAIYASLLAGRPVMVWIGLSEGPYATWHSRSGALVRVNYGEHAVLLTGIDAETVTANDPLSGERLTWPKSQFEAMWKLLGSRALAA